MQQSILLVQTTLRMLTMEEYPVNGSETFSSRAFISITKEKDRGIRRPAQYYDKKYSRSIADYSTGWGLARCEIKISYWKVRSYLLRFISERVSSVPACQRETKIFYFFSLSTAIKYTLSFSPGFCSIYLLILLIWDHLLWSHLCSVRRSRAEGCLFPPWTGTRTSTLHSRLGGAQWKSRSLRAYVLKETILVPQSLQVIYTAHNYCYEHLTEEAEAETRPRSHQPKVIQHVSAREKYVQVSNSTPPL